MGWLRPYPTRHCEELRHDYIAVAGITDDFHILADAMRNAPALFNVLGTIIRVHLTLYARRVQRAKHPIIQ